MYQAEHTQYSIKETNNNARRGEERKGDLLCLPFIGRKKPTRPMSCSNEQKQTSKHSPSPPSLENLVPPLKPKERIAQTRKPSISDIQRNCCI